MNIYTYAYIYTFACRHTRIYACIQKYKFTFILAKIPKHIHIHIFSYTYHILRYSCLYLHLLTDIYFFFCMCYLYWHFLAYICIWQHIYIYTIYLHIFYISLHIFHLFTYWRLFTYIHVFTTMYIYLHLLSFTFTYIYLHLFTFINIHVRIFEGSLEVKLPTIWTVEKQRWEESEEKRSEERRCRCAKR